MKILDTFAIIICIIALFLYFNKNNSAQTNTISFDQVVKECQRAIDSKECSILSIKDQIKQASTSYATQNAIWDTNDELFDALTGNKLLLNTHNLNNYQKNVWYSYINEKTRIIDFEKNKIIKQDVISYGIIILLILITLIISIPIINLIWRFILNRISDISDAAKGKKF